MLGRHQVGDQVTNLRCGEAFEQDASDFAVFARKPLPMPMLVIGGEKASGEFLATQARLVASNVQSVVVPGAGHWLMEEAPEPTMSALVQFINSSPP